MTLITRLLICNAVNDGPVWFKGAGGRNLFAPSVIRRQHRSTWFEANPRTAQYASAANQETKREGKAWRECCV